MNQSDAYESAVQHLAMLQGYRIDPPDIVIPHDLDRSDFRELVFNERERLDMEGIHAITISDTEINRIWVHHKTNECGCRETWVDQVAEVFDHVIKEEQC